MSPLQGRGPRMLELGLGPVWEQPSVNLLLLSSGSGQNKLGTSQFLTPLKLVLLGIQQHPY